jgi:hypothetical protein
LPDRASADPGRRSRAILERQARRPHRSTCSRRVRAPALGPARHPSAEALLADLRAFQAGLAVSAVRDGLWTRLLRFCRRHRSVILIALPALLLLGGVGWMWQRERALARADWRLVVDERFDDPVALATGWRTSLVPNYRSIKPVDLVQSGWSVVDGALVGDDRQGRCTNLARIDLPGGSIRASWLLTSVLGGTNLNCFVGAPNRLDGYTIHVGGWGRQDFVAVTRSSGDMLDSRTLTEPLRAGRTYRVELEFDQGVLRFAIDGVQLLSCRDPDPIPGSEQGGFGFEASWSVVRIDDLRVQVRPQARLASPLAAADALASTGAHSRAASSYLGFARTWPDDPLAPLARLRGARAQLRAGLSAEALPSLEQLADAGVPAIASVARYELLRVRATMADDAVLDRLVDGLARSAPDVTLARLGLIAARDAVLARESRPSAQSVITLIGRMRRWAEQLGLPAEETESFIRCAELLNAQGYHEEVLRLTPEATLPNIQALLSLARFDEVHRRFPAIHWARYDAWSDAGRLEDGLREGTDPFWRGRMLRETGRLREALEAVSPFDQAAALTQLEGPESALRRHPDQVMAIAVALIVAGRPGEALALPGLSDAVRIDALLQMGQFAQAAALAKPGSRKHLEATACEAISRLASGDGTAAVKLFEQPVDYSWSRYEDWFDQHFATFVLPGLITWRMEGRDPLPHWRSLAAEQCRRSGLRVDYRWNGLLGLADTTAILSQPFRGGGHPQQDAALIAAIRADLAGDPAAVALWNQYLAIAPFEHQAARAWARLRSGR